MKTLCTYLKHFRIVQIPILVWTWTFTNLGIKKFLLELDNYLLTLEYYILNWTTASLVLDSYLFGIGQLLNSDWTTNYLLATTYLELDNYLFRIGQLIIPYLWMFKFLTGDWTATYLGLNNFLFGINRDWHLDYNLLEKIKKIFWKLSGNLSGTFRIDHYLLAIRKPPI